MTASEGIVMRHLLISCAAIMVPLLAAGCVRYPTDYSPHYQAVPLGPSALRNSRERHALVPDSCLMAEPTDVTIDQGRLPAGCANADNLLSMVERKEDLARGRPLGPAPAGPSSRAAERYLDGEESQTGGGSNPTVRGGGTTQEEPVPPRSKNSPAVAGGAR